MFPCDDEIMVYIEILYLVKFRVFDNVRGVSMVPKGIVNLGLGVVRFYEFIKNPSVVSMLG